MGAVDGTFTAQIITAPGAIRVIEKKEGKINNVCFIASNKSEIKKQVDKMKDSDVDANVTSVSYAKPNEKQILNGDIPLAQAVHTIFNDTEELTEGAKDQCLAVIKSHLNDKDKQLFITIGDDPEAFWGNFTPMSSTSNLDANVLRVSVAAATFA